MIGNIVGQMKRFVQQHYAWLFSGIVPVILVALWKLISPMSESHEHTTQYVGSTNIDSNGNRNIFHTGTGNINFNNGDKASMEQQSPMRSDTEERIKILQLRAEKIQSAFESTKKYSAEKQFTQLHIRHTQAIESGQELLAHEIVGKIHDLLSRYRDIRLGPTFYTVAEVKIPPSPPMSLQIVTSAPRAPRNLKLKTVEDKHQAVSNTEVHAGAFDPSGFDPNGFDTGSLHVPLSDSEVKEIRKDTKA